jgi:pimeloyl-ACP methyl ester carboxylesterase
MMIVKRILFASLVLCMLALTAPALWNVYANRAARQRAVISGKLYSVNGYDMHLDCSGAGSPAIVLSTGLGDNFTVWAKVQPELAKVTRVCSYDRAGMGWSQPRPGVPDSDSVAAQLHQLLAVAGVERPFVLVGHSISGLHVRAYGSRYQSDLAGIVLLDPSTPHQGDRFPQELVNSLADYRRDMVRQRWQMTMGWPRLLGKCGAVPSGFEADRPFVEDWNCDPTEVKTVIEEIDAWGASERETDSAAIGAQPFGATPLLILSRDPNLAPSQDDRKAMSATAYTQMQHAWDAMQEETKSLSSNSRRVIAKGSTHYVQADRADLVIREVTALIEEIHQHQPMSNQDSTIVK